ncbi:SpaA isopeptide-forming pilin-related protein [Enterococcus rotai]|uniref:SpaA isopeptide-forming pilin-related protein n=1 Tax=Enterococcus rotai TaxID=118060 RepID=UPI0032B5FAE6
MKKKNLVLTSLVLASTLFQTLVPLGKVVFAEGNEKEMYEVGKTEDGKVILSSAKKLKNSRAVGNVQGDVIRITIGGVLYEGARITIDGKPAFCIDRELRAPWEADTPYDAGSPFDNKGAKAIMSYGAFSPFYPNPSDEEVILTEIALHNYLSGKHTQESAVSNSHPFVWDLVQKALAGNVPETKINFSKNDVKSDIVGNEQVSETVTLNGANNQVTINVPVDVTFTNLTTGKKVTNGKATVKAGDKFQVKAPLNYNKKYTTGKVKPEKGEFIPIMFKPFSVGYQRLLQGSFSDPTPMMELNVDFFARTGDVKITKLDEGTGEPVPNTEFDVEHDGKVEKVKTDAKGEGTVKGITGDSKAKVTETFVPAPYVKATNNTKEVTVRAGQVTLVEFRNERATGKSTLTKVDKTTETNKPLNPTYPMIGAKYGWFKEDGTLISEFTLDDKFTATVDKQPLGSYYWAETLAPVGYTLDPEKHVVELTYKDQDTPVVIKDSKSNDDSIRMNIDWQKLIQNKTNEMFKNGVEFTATNQRTKEEIVKTTATVDGKKGYVKFADLAIDDYLITETKGVEGYDPVDPILVKHVYDKETNSFTFTVTDQKSGNVLNEETLTQEELAKGENVDLGTYTLKDKATVNEEPIVGISTQAHTGDGKTQTFVWGENVKFYDDVTITHKNFPENTILAYETIQVAVYTDKEGKETEKDVWSSGKVDLKETDEKITERVLSEYDYKKDPKGTRYYFKELVYVKKSDKEYEKVAEHNFDGKEKTQDIIPKEEPVKETPKTPETPKETPKGSLPSTGEQMMRGATVVGLLILLGVAGGMYLKRKNATDSPEEKTEENN